MSGLMIISRRRRRLKKPTTDKESISVECHNPEIHSSEHRGQGEIRKEYVVSCMWRETRNLWDLRHRTDSLKVHRCIGTHSLSKD